MSVAGMREQLTQRLNRGVLARVRDGSAGEQNGVCTGAAAKTGGAGEVSHQPARNMDLWQ
jgi:hypothetical protein